MCIYRGCTYRELTVLTFTLTNLNVILAGRSRENKTVSYPIFNRRENKNINDFIIKLKEAFAINRITNNKKYIIAISYLKRIVANFYDRLVRIINWNIVGQLANTQLREVLIMRFKLET